MIDDIGLYLSLMKKALLSILLFTLVVVDGFGQQNPLFSHYMLNPNLFNPGFAGVGNTAFLSAGHRSQWLGYNTTLDGTGAAPISQNISLSVPVKGLISGTGINFLNDNIGPVNNIKVQPILALSRKVKNGNLTLGIAPAIITQTLNFNELRFVDPSDPFNVGSRQTQTSPDLDLGLVYSTEKMDLGLSVQNVLEASFNFGIDQLGNNYARSFVGTWRYRYAPIYNFVFMPSMIVRYGLNTTTFDAGVMATYQDRIWGGLSYRFSEAIILLLGYSFMEDNQLRVGYSFDYVVSNQEAKQPTSHEIFLRYNLPSFSFGGKKIIRTPRFIF